MRKAGWSGRSAEWRKVDDLKAVRYQGVKASVGWREWRDWRDWVGGGRGVGSAGWMEGGRGRGG